MNASITLSTLVQAYAFAKEVAPEVKAVASYIGDQVQAAEAAFADKVSQGATKLQAVLAALKVVWDKLTTGDVNHFVDQIKQIIADAKDAWNAMMVSRNTAPAV